MLACLVTPTTMIFFNDEMCTWYYSIYATVGWMRMTPAPVPPPTRQNTRHNISIGSSPSFHRKHQSQVENSETLDFIFVFSKLIFYLLSFIRQKFPCQIRAIQINCFSVLSFILLPLSSRFGRWWAMGEINQFYPLSFRLYPLKRGGSYLRHSDHGSQQRVSPLSLILLPLSFLRARPGHGSLPSFRFQL